jgi:hypothetical protein
MIQVPSVSLGNVQEQATMLKLSLARMAHASGDAFERLQEGHNHTATAVDACDNIRVG